MKLLRLTSYSLFVLLSISLLSCSKKDKAVENPPEVNPSHNKLVKTTAVNPTTGAETPIWQIAYNSNGKISSAQWQNTVFAVEYNTNGSISKIARTENGGTSKQITLEYDNQGLLAKLYEQGTNTMLYVYGGNELFSAYYGTPILGNAYTEYTWDNGNVSEQQLYNLRTLQSTVKNLAYDDKKNPFRDLAYFMIPAGNLVAFSKNNLLNSTNYNPDQTVSSSFTSVYTYNSLGYPATGQVTTNTGTVSKTKYYYGE